VIVVVVCVLRVFDPLYNFFMK